MASIFTSKFNRFLCLCLCFILCFSFFAPPAHASMTIALGLGALALAFGTALGYISTTSGFSASGLGDYWTGQVEHWANSNSFDFGPIINQVDINSAGKLTLGAHLAAALASFWSDYSSDNSLSTSSPTSSTLSGYFVNGFPLTTVSGNDAVLSVPRPVFSTSSSLSFYLSNASGDSIPVTLSIDADFNFTYVVDGITTTHSGADIPSQYASFYGWYFVSSSSPAGVAFTPCFLYGSGKNKSNEK